MRADNRRRRRLGRRCGPRRCRRRRYRSEKAGSKEVGADSVCSYILCTPAPVASLCCKSVTCNVNTLYNGHSSPALFPSKTRPAF